MPPAPGDRLKGASGQLKGGHMRLIASPETVTWVGVHGGLLFVWPVVSRGPRLVLKRLECSVDPPLDALDFDRLEVAPFMVFAHPRLWPPPTDLLVEVHGLVHPRACAFWDGLAYAM
jgi:hypothetical protein